MRTKNFLIIIVILVIIIAGFVFFKQPSDKVQNENVVLTGETKEFEIIVKNWEFVPNAIEVNQGDRVKLHLEVIEGYHGFALPEFGINEKLDEGTKVYVEFIADKKGIFNFYCSVPCGQGHGGMNGRLIVK